MRMLIVGLLVVLTSIGVRADDEESVRTEETSKLFDWLSEDRGIQALGGQWNGGTSIGWVEQANISGREPLIFGLEYFDYGPIEKNLPNRELAAQFIKDKYARGGVVTLVDHMPNFVTGGDSWDRNGGTLRSILPGEPAHAEFVAYLDRLAVFLNGLTLNGKPVPVLLRPLHEMNGSWFWWGDSASGDRFIKVWRFYRDYLVRRKGVRNVLWVWSPNIERDASEARYMKYWPGSNYVDVVGLDGYDNTAVADVTNPSFSSSFDAMSKLAANFRLPFAFTELGFNPGAREQAGLWDENVLNALRGRYSRLRYVLLWNAEWGPRAGTPAAEGFSRLVGSGQVLMLGSERGQDIYGSEFGR